MKAFLIVDELTQFHWVMLKSVLLILGLLPIAEVFRKKVQGFRSYHSRVSRPRSIQ